MRMRKKKNLAPRMERCDDLWIREPEGYKGKWRTLMPDCRELRLELGCGKGGFTVKTAQAEPDVLFIAVERVPDAMVIAMERAEQAELSNVYFVDADAARLPEYFEPGEVDRIYLNFSDPVALQPPCQTAADASGFPEQICVGIEGQGGGPLQNGQPRSV